MKGIVLAGGNATRLYPITLVNSKQLLPVYDKPMVYYPLSTLMTAGINDILIISTPHDLPRFEQLLGDGSQVGCRFSYKVQAEPKGLAEAFIVGADFIGRDKVGMILGDNIFDENFLPHISSFQSGAMTFYKAVPDPERFGVVELDGFGQVRSIEEKPARPKSNFAQVGLYVYEPSVFEIIKTIKPSARGQLEIVDVNNQYLRQGKLIAKPVKGFWSDAGTFPSMRRASEYFASREG